MYKSKKISITVNLWQRYKLCFLSYEFNLTWSFIMTLTVEHDFNLFCMGNFHQDRMLCKKLSFMIAVYIFNNGLILFCCGLYQFNLTVRPIGGWTGCHQKTNTKLENRYWLLYVLSVDWTSQTGQHLYCAPQQHFIRSQVILLPTFYILKFWGQVLFFTIKTGSSCSY